MVHIILNVNATSQCKTNLDHQQLKLITGRHQNDIALQPIPISCISECPLRPSFALVKLPFHVILSHKRIQRLKLPTNGTQTELQALGFENRSGVHVNQSNWRSAKKGTQSIRHSQFKI